MASKNYYEILGVDKNASKEEISKAYKKAAMKWHPDRQYDKTDAEKKEAEEKFKECAEAADVLTDDTKRQQYDTFGTVGNGQMDDGFDPFSFFRSFAGGGFGMFGGNSGFPGFGDNEFGASTVKEPDLSLPEDGRDIQLRLKMSFADAFYGCTKSFEIDMSKECPECGGKGIENGSKLEKCTHCNGTGRIVHTQRNGFMMQQHISQCNACNGTGFSAKPCHHCHGEQRISSKSIVNATFPAGIKDGQRIRIKNKGECGIKGGNNGDLYILASISKSNVFEYVNSNDIATVLPLNPIVASLGGEVDIETPYGMKKIVVPAGTCNGKMFKLEGEGVRKGSIKGDMYVKVSISPLSNLSDEQKATLSSMLEKFESKHVVGLNDFASKVQEFKQNHC